MFIFSIQMIAWLWILMSSINSSYDPNKDALAIGTTEGTYWLKW